MGIRKIITAKKNTTRIYIVMYDQQEFFGPDTTIPIKAFKTKKTAELYADSRNFEFQSICMLDEEDYERYVLSNQYSDYVISISDFRDAHAFIKEEMLRLQKNKIPIDVWELIEDIKPFKVIPIEYLENLRNL